MEVRFNGQLRKARITSDYPENRWRIIVFDATGAVAATLRSREDILNAGLQVQQTTDHEMEYLSQNGWLPPYDDNK